MKSKSHLNCQIFPIKILNYIFNLSFSSYIRQKYQVQIRKKKTSFSGHNSTHSVEEFGVHLLFGPEQTTNRDLYISAFLPEKTPDDQQIFQKCKQNSD